MELPAVRGGSSCRQKFSLLRRDVLRKEIGMIEGTFGGNWRHIVAQIVLTILFVVIGTMMAFSSRT